MPTKQWPPETLDDRLTLLQPIGKGGYGHVYVARDTQLAREVAVKLFRPPRLAGQKAEDAVARFRREARLTGSFESQHIPRVHSLGFDRRSRTPYVVMELLRGRDLAKWVAANGPMPVRMAVPLLIQVAYGLHAGHRRGIVHLDVKPANLFLHESQDPPFDFILKVLDFGIVWKKEEGSATPTFFHSTLNYAGTEAFRSPEQVLGHTTYTPASDVFSLAATAIYLLTGARPFRVAELNPLLTASGARAVPPERLDRSEPDLRMPSLLGVVPDLAPELDAVLQRALSFAPNDRFQNADEFATALIEAWRDCMGEPVPSLTAAVQEQLVRLAAHEDKTGRSSGEPGTLVLPAAADPIPPGGPHDGDGVPATRHAPATAAAPVERSGPGDDVAPAGADSTPAAEGMAPAPVGTSTETSSATSVPVEEVPGATRTETRASDRRADETRTTATRTAAAADTDPLLGEAPAEFKVDETLLAGPPAPAHPCPDASLARPHTDDHATPAEMPATATLGAVAGIPVPDAAIDALLGTIDDGSTRDTTAAAPTDTPTFNAAGDATAERGNTSVPTDGDAAGAPRRGVGETDPTVAAVLPSSPSAKRPESAAAVCAPAVPDAAAGAPPRGMGKTAPKVAAVHPSSAPAKRPESVAAVRAPAVPEQPAQNAAGRTDTGAPRRPQRRLRSALLLVLALLLIPSGAWVLLNPWRPRDRMAAAPTGARVDGSVREEPRGPPQPPEAGAPTLAKPVPTQQTADAGTAGTRSELMAGETETGARTPSEAQRERPSRTRNRTSGLGRPVFPGQNASAGYYDPYTPLFDYSATRTQVQTALRDADILDFSRDYLGAASLLRQVLSSLQPHRYSSAAADEWARDIEAKLREVRQHCETIANDPLLSRDGRPQCPG